MTKTIMVVDDDSDTLATIKKVLTKERYKIEAATGGTAALELLKKSKPDLILLDILMPTLSGYEVLRLLRERLNHKVKIVYLTIVPRVDVNLSDIDGFIQKPFSPETLLEGIKKVLKT